MTALPTGDSELYSHPRLGESRDEFEALVSPRVRRLAGQFGVKLFRCQDL